VRHAEAGREDEDREDDLVVDRVAVGITRNMVRLCMSEAEGRDELCCGEGGVEAEQQPEECGAPPTGYAPSRFSVEEDVHAVGRNVDHGEFIRELSLVEHGSMESKGANANEGETL
jgi:hypothetical protein